MLQAMTVRTWGGLAAALLASSSMAHQATDGTGNPFAGVTLERLDVDYDVSDGMLASCRVRKSTGDDDIDEAVCTLIERCVDQGATERKAISACVTPYLVRLQTMARSGTLASAVTPAVVSSPTVPQVTTPSAAPGGNDGEIVVQGRRVRPRTGLWLFREAGRREYIPRAKDRLGMEIEFASLPVRHWQRCIREDEVEATLSLMMRENEVEVAASPCPWTVKASGNTVEGSRICARDGAMIRSSMTGRYQDDRIVVLRRAQIRRMAGMRPRPPGPDQSEPELVSDQMLDETTLTGRRTAECTDAQQRLLEARSR
jgi:hypothetical protein